MIKKWTEMAENTLRITLRFNFLRAIDKTSRRTSFETNFQTLFVWNKLLWNKAKSTHEVFRFSKNALLFSFPHKSSPWQQTA